MIHDRLQYLPPDVARRENTQQPSKQGRLFDEGRWSSEAPLGNPCQGDSPPYDLAAEQSQAKTATPKQRLEDDGLRRECRDS